MFNNLFQILPRMSFAGDRRPLVWKTNDDFRHTGTILYYGGKTKKNKRIRNNCGKKTFLFKKLFIIFKFVQYN